MPKPANPPVNENDRRHFLRIANHHFHDATLEKISVIPAVNKRHRARIEVLLSFPHVELLYALTFTGCTNVSLALDFDVLADNIPYNSDGVTKLKDTAESSSSSPPKSPHGTPRIVIPAPHRPPVSTRAPRP